MDIEAKMQLIRGFAEEIVEEDGLKELLESNDHPTAYDGFEPSGIAPIHFGLQRARNLKLMLSAGIRFKLYLADYFGMINNKLGGNLEDIQAAGRYFVEVWRGAGIDTSKVEIVWASELMDGIKYWDRFMRVGMAASTDRIKRAVTIMGRREGDRLSAAQLFYPAMQVTDIFQMDLDICQLGMDQRRANMLAREVAQKYGWKVPVAVHHPLMIGLQGMPAGVSKKDADALIGYKMSKSDPKSAIYVHDTFDEIKSKINSAYCPERIVEGNPLFNYLRLAILGGPGERITIERPQKFGGALDAEGYGELARLYTEGKLHPADLKAYVAGRLEEMIKPVREHFEKNRGARELYEAVRGFKITR